MFDAKSLLEALVKGAGPTPASQQSGSPGLGDLLGGLLQGGQGGQAQSGGLNDILRQMLPGAGGPGQPQAGQPQANGGGNLEDMIRNMFPSGRQDAQQQSRTPRTSAGTRQQQAEQPQAGAPEGGSLGDILGKLQQQLGPGGGNIADILKQVLGQAVDGAREGAGRIGQSTGAGDAIGKMTGGKSADEIIAQIKDLVAKNPLGAGTAIGGLGSLILGTQTGRSIAVGAAKLGALALIGGLAYKAYQNYSQGKPIIAGRDAVPQEAPKGSGFEPGAVTHESAQLYIRAMIAAAAADGRIDQTEQQKILGGLKQAGLDSQAEDFLANELNNPATADDIASEVRTQEEAVQVYTAARIAIEPDGAAESAFLAQLASRLGIDAKLAAHIDGAARGAAA